MKKYLLELVSIVFIVILILQGCSSSYQRTKLLNEEIIKNNKNKISSLSYGMSLKEVLELVNDNLSRDARKENPKYAAEFEGKGSLEYLVQFYEYSDPGYKGNIKFRDDRYFPLLFKEKILVGINWDDYENLIGVAFVTSDGKKAKSGADIKTDEKDSRQLAKGTGFLINNNGYVVTNYHVVENAEAISIYSPTLDKKFTVSGVMKDISNDLAILKIVDSTYSYDTFRKINYRIVDQNEIKVGQEVFTLGFPLTTFLGTTARLSNGIINSKLGFQGDPRTFQINNPLQPGNSGGPLFNMEGNLIGVVVATLNASFILYHTGTLPQNVNFAIKADYLRIMLESGDLGIPKSDSIKVDELKLEDLVEQLNEFVVMIICE